MLHRARGLALFLAVWPRAGAAQAPPRTARIGYLSPLSAETDRPHLEALREGLHALGYVEGRNLVIETRHAQSRFERLPALAAELVRLDVDVIVASPTPAVRAAQQATASIPIVMAFSGDPVGDRFAAEPARPGGNITGHSASVAEMAGRTLGLQVTTMAVRDIGEVDRAFSAMRQKRVDGLVVALTLQQYWKRIVELALRSRLPTVSGPREFVEAGGLMAYGPHYPDLFRRTASYVDKILRGARPADLPIEQPTRFEFVISRRTARALGLAISPALLLRADHVIE